MYAEFHNLGALGRGVTSGYEDGITFKVTNVSLVGTTLRLRLGANDWYFVRSHRSGFVFFGRTFSDFGMSDQPAEYFKCISARAARQQLEPQNATHKELAEAYRRWRKEWMEEH